MSRFKLGLQLFSVREYISEDMEATLKAVSDMGYDCVEFAGFYGKSADEVKQLCEKYNLIPLSVHRSHEEFIKEPEKNIEYLKTLGTKFCAIPYISQNTWENEYDKTVCDIIKVGELLKKNNIQLLYHNHSFEFKIKHGEDCLLDYLYKNIPHDILSPELDICWVHYAGYNPIEYIERYGDIEEILHIKDFTCNNPELASLYGTDAAEKSRNIFEDGFEFRAVGHGIQDIPTIMKTAENTKIKYIIVEQDEHTTGKNSLEDAKDSIDYLRSIGY